MGLNRHPWTLKAHALLTEAFFLVSGGVKGCGFNPIERPIFSQFHHILLILLWMLKILQKRLYITSLMFDLVH